MVPLNNTKSYLGNYGTITGPNGSKYWRYGLDVDLKVDDPVYSPVSGEVIDARMGYNGGFGNQVKIRDQNGNEIWLSHLKDFNVKPGMRVNSGQAVGRGGASGNVIKAPGADGSHLDITIKTPQGYMSAPQVREYVESNFSPTPAVSGNKILKELGLINKTIVNPSTLIPMLLKGAIGLIPTKMGTQGATSTSKTSTPTSGGSITYDIDW